MIILALDASSTHIGYCIGEDADYVISGVFVPKGKADEWVAQIVTWALDRIRRYEPDIVVIEEPAANNSHRNARTDRLLSQVCGAVEAVAICFGCRSGASGRPRSRRRVAVRTLPALPLAWPTKRASGLTRPMRLAFGWRG